MMYTRKEVKVEGAFYIHSTSHDLEAVIHWDSLVVAEQTPSD